MERGARAALRARRAADRAACAPACRPAARSEGALSGRRPGLPGRRRASACGHRGRRLACDRRRGRGGGARSGDHAGRCQMVSIDGTHRPFGDERARPCRRARRMVASRNDPVRRRARCDPADGRARGRCAVHRLGHHLSRAHRVRRALRHGSAETGARALSRWRASLVRSHRARRRHAFAPIRCDSWRSARIWHNDRNRRATRATRSLPRAAEFDARGETVR